VGTILSPLLSWLAALVCVIAGFSGAWPGLDERDGHWISQDGHVRVTWATTTFTATIETDGALVLSDASTRGRFTVVTAATGRDCVQRAALEIGTAPSVMFFDLSLADRPATDPTAIAGIFQFSQAGQQRIAYVECRGIAPDSAGRFLDMRIVSPAETWPEAVDRWSAVLIGIEMDARGFGCAFAQRSVHVRTVPG
jgi:hypothetical protein